MATLGCTVRCCYLRITGANVLHTMGCRPSSTPSNNVAIPLHHEMEHREALQLRRGWAWATTSRLVFATTEKTISGSSYTELDHGAELVEEFENGTRNGPGALRVERREVVDRTAPSRR